MLRRRSILAAATTAVVTPSTLLLAGCGGGERSLPAPAPLASVALKFPVDYYAHTNPPTEWWWHTGTLRSGSRVFGFEINAASFEKDGIAFSQISLADVANNKYYQSTSVYLPPLNFNAATWAEHDPTKDWSVQLGNPASAFSAIQVVNPGQGYTSAPTVTISGGGGILAFGTAVIDAQGHVTNVLVASPGLGYTSLPTVTLTGGGGTGATARAVPTYITMRAPAADPTRNLEVKALVTDDATGTPVSFDLNMSQEGPPLIVWGTGVNEGAGSAPPLQRNNYYYSFTNLRSSGTITIGSEKLPVTGVTWMDHEYGAFGSSQHPVKWILEAMQLDNGWSISNYTVEVPVLNKPAKGKATILAPDGRVWYVDTIVTPFGRTWTSPQSGRTYFMEIRVDISDFDASLTVTSLIEAQEFTGTAPVYEGVASAVGVFLGARVTGTAWNEQAL
ncbi:MAG: lipocalin-like domain-containing protein [Pseudomonadota bacterium]